MPIFLFFFSFPPQLREAALLNTVMECRSAVHVTYPILTVTKCLIATSAKMHTTHYTLSALPCIVSTVCHSDPSQLLWGGKRHRSEVRIFKLTPDSLNTWDFCTQEAAHQGFQNDMHTCILSMQPIPILFVCVLIVVRE